MRSIEMTNASACVHTNHSTGDPWCIGSQICLAQQHLPAQLLSEQFCREQLAFPEANVFHKDVNSKFLAQNSNRKISPAIYHSSECLLREYRLLKITMLLVSTGVPEARHVSKRDLEQEQKGKRDLLTIEYLMPA